MLRVLKKIDVENIPVIRAIFDGMITSLTYSLLLWIIYIVNFQWFIIPLVLIAISSSIASGILEDKKIIKIEVYKSAIANHMLQFVNFIVFWFLISYLCLNVKMSQFTLCLAIFAGALSLIKTISAVLILPTVMNSLKIVRDIRVKYGENKSYFDDTIKEVLGESKKLKGQLIKSLVFAFFPALLSVVFLWWFFYRITVILNAPIELKLFMFFVIIFEIVLSNFSRALKKELINKTIEKDYE